MRKLIFSSLMFLTALPAFAQENDEAKIKTAVEDRYKEFVAAVNKKDISAVTNLFDQNAVMMPVREQPVIGRVAIGSWYNALFANPRFVGFSLALNWNSFHSVGDIAIETSVFDSDVTREGKHIHFQGKNLLVWKKQPDGSWKLFRYMYDEIQAMK